MRDLRSRSLTHIFNLGFQNFKIFLTKFPYCSNQSFPLADLRGPNSFNFMQFWGKFCKIVCWRPLLELAPIPRENPGSDTVFYSYYSKCENAKKIECPNLHHEKFNAQMFEVSARLWQIFFHGKLDY